MAMRQPIKSTASAMRAKVVVKAHVGDGLEAILQNNPQLRRLVVQAKDRGSVTFDQLNAALPQDFPPEQTEEVIQLLDAQGIMVLRDEPGGDIEAEPADAEPAAEGEQAAGEAAEGEEGTPPPEEELGRTDDPVRMYLREMGTIELLSREGEIEIAKRIEAGRNTVLEALCESPLTMRAVIGWRDAIREGRVLLRDIIDLEATNDAGPAELGCRCGAAAAAPSHRTSWRCAVERWRPWSSPRPRARPRRRMPPPTRRRKRDPLRVPERRGGARTRKPRRPGVARGG